MADSFGSRLVEATSQWSSPSPDVDRIKVRGRRIRRGRWLGATMVFLVVAGAVGWTLSALVATSRTDERRIAAPEQRAITGAFGAAEVTGSPTDAAATFAIRSVAGAGLVDPLGLTWDYLGITGADGAWTASFEVIECRAPAERVRVESEICPRTGRLVDVTVELEAGSFKVTAVSEDATVEERSRLLAWIAERETEPAHFEDLVVKVSSPGDEPVAHGWSLWTGPIPAPDLFTQCVFEYFDKESALLHRSRTVELRVSNSDEQFNPGSGEAQRDGNTPWISEGPREAADFADARLSCATYRWTDGPELGDLASNGYRVTDLDVSYSSAVYGADAPALIRIGYNAGWDTDVFPGARVCTWTLRNDSGEAIARERSDIYRLEPGFAESSGTYAEFEVDRLPASISFECGERFDDPDTAHEAQIDDFRAVDGAVLVDWSHRWPGEDSTTGASDCTLRFEDSAGNAHTAREPLGGAGEGSTTDHRFEMPADFDPFSVVDVSVACIPHVPQR